MSALVRFFPSAFLALALIFGGSLSTAYSADKPGDEKHAAEGAGDHGGGHGGGVSLPMNFKEDLALWSLVTFVVFFLVLSKLAWKPLTAALDGRESGIQKNILEAESARVKAQQLLADHEQKLAKVQDQVRAILDEARKDAETAKQNILSEATRQAAAERTRALAEIEQAKNQALDQLFDAMSDRVVAATEHVIGRSLGEGDHSRLVNEALQQVAPKA